MVYIALLRAINVGGKNMIKMEELRLLFEELGFQKVQSYIQSGNILFVSNDKEEILKVKIESAIIATFGLEIDVIIRSIEELKDIIENCPFSQQDILEYETNIKAEHLYVYILQNNPSQEETEKVSVYDTGEDKYEFKGRALYVLFKESIRTSKLTRGIQKMKIQNTSRNWKTLLKLVEMGKSY